MSDSISPPPPISMGSSSSWRRGIMPETDWPTLPAASRTCSTTRLITLWLCGRGADPARDVLLRLVDALRRGAERFVLALFFVERLAAAFFPPRRAALREGARRFAEALFFDDLERF